MDSHVILEASRASMAGTLPFPEIVALLIHAGVESYRVDYTTLQQTFYGADGSVAMTPLPFEDLPPVAADFSAANLRSAIFDSQNNGQKFRPFTQRAMSAGVQGYIAFLAGQRVTYWGRKGDQHTEWFPGSNPQVTT